MNFASLSFTSTRLHYNGSTMSGRKKNKLDLTRAVRLDDFMAWSKLTRDVIIELVDYCFLNQLSLCSDKSWEELLVVLSRHVQVINHLLIFLSCSSSTV